MWPLHLQAAILPTPYTQKGPERWPTVSPLSWYTHVLNQEVFKICAKGSVTTVYYTDSRQASKAQKSSIKSSSWTSSDAEIVFAEGVLLGRPFTIVAVSAAVAQAVLGTGA